MKDFFVSYNSQDKAWAEWIAWQLEAAGYAAIIQAWDFRPGGNFVLDMQRAAEEAERTIAVLSQNYLEALYTQPEWAAAFAQDPTGARKTLLPVRVQVGGVQRGQRFKQESLRGMMARSGNKRVLPEEDLSDTT